MVEKMPKIGSRTKTIVVAMSVLLAVAIVVFGFFTVGFSAG